MPTAPRELLDGCRRSRHDGAGRASRRNPPRTSGQRGAVPGRTPVGTPGRGRARAQPGAGVSPLPPPPVPPSAPLGPPTEILPQPLQLRPQLEHSGLGAQQAEPQPRVLLAGTVPLAQPAQPAAAPNPAHLPAWRPRAAAAAARRPRPARAPSWPGETGPRCRALLVGVPPSGRTRPSCRRTGPPSGAEPRGTAGLRRVCSAGGAGARGAGPHSCGRADTAPQRSPGSGPSRIALGTGGCHGMCPSVLHGAALGHREPNGRREGSVRCGEAAVPGAAAAAARTGAGAGVLLAPAVPSLKAAARVWSRWYKIRSAIYVKKDVFTELFTIPTLPGR